MSNLKKIISSVDSFDCIGGVSDGEIARAEKVLGLKFADEYKEYLKEYGTGFFDTMEPTGLNISKRLNVVDITLMERELRSLPKEFYVIENLAIDFLLILQNDKGEVFEVDGTGNRRKIFNSFAEYISDNI